jgi:hypothetical protein
MNLRPLGPWAFHAKHGVAIWIRNDTEAKTKLNAIAVKVKLRKTITICSLYIPPNEAVSNNKLRRLIRQLPKPFIITGDLNAHSRRWGGRKENRIGKIITKIIDEENLSSISSEKIISTIQKCAKENIKKTKEEAPKRKLKWRTAEIISSLQNYNIRERRKSERTYKRTPSTKNLIAYKKLKAQTRQAVKEKRKNQWNQLTESITAKTSSQKVWEKIRKISGKRKSHQIKRLIKSNGQSIISPLEIANELASQFSKTNSNANYLSNFRKKKEETEKKQTST